MQTSSNISFLESLIFVTCDFDNQRAELTLHGSSIQLPLSRAKKSCWRINGALHRFQTKYPHLDGELAAPFAIDAMGRTALQLTLTARNWPIPLLQERAVTDTIWPVADTLYGPTERQAIAEIQALRPKATRVGVYFVDAQILQNRQAVNFVAQEPITVGLGLTERIARQLPHPSSVVSVVADFDVLQQLHDLIVFTQSNRRGSFSDAEKIYARLEASLPTNARRQRNAPSKWDFGTKLTSSSQLYGGRFLLLD